MNRLTYVLVVVAFASGCQSTQMAAVVPQAPQPLLYTVDLTDRADDLFRVTLTVDDLGADNAVYQFASTAPGTYQVMNMGRFVRSFTAFDGSGASVPVEQISTNQWQLQRPQDVARIEYAIAETWDTQVDENPIYLMAGSSIEDDHVLINGQTVFGFPQGMQSRPLRIRLVVPDGWKVGTAMAKDTEGRFIGSDYDYVVDSPILLGRLSTAALDVEGTKVEIYTYSKTDKVASVQILDSIRDILFAANEFLGGLPVDRYTFLFHFEDITMGAWEHSYSSEYVYAEADFEWAISESIPSVVAHEFFHIVTPLNIHSEIIERFNYSEPVASEHLWLYEGVTEWASDIMQLRAGLITLDEFLSELSSKLRTDDAFDKRYSLSKLSLTSYTPEGQAQFPNVYMRGALVAGLLDIKLLQLSDGKRGLREVLIELSRRYGPDTPFPEKEFFSIFAEMTYPEISDFFERYVRSAEPLPLADYLGLLGLHYLEAVDTGESTTAAGIGLNFVENNVVVTSVAEEIANCDIRVGDQFASLDGQEISIETVRSVLGQFRSVAAGVPYTVGLVRDGEEMTATCAKYERPLVHRHVLALDSAATADQRALRDVWMKNLPLALN